MLPEIVKVAAGKIPIVMDGGIRSGSDILKALLLGANAIQIGRPVLWGLAVGGMYGVCGVIKQFKQWTKSQRMVVLRSA